MTRFFLAILTGLMIVLASCSGGGDVVDIDDVGSSSSSSSSSTTSSSTTTTEPPAEDPPAGAEDAVVETWTSLLAAAASGGPDDDEAAVIESLANSETVEQLFAPLFPEFPNREIDFFPALTEQEDGSYAIDDCLVMNRGISEGVSNWFVGAAEPSDASPTGFVITDISVINLDPCVPRSIADAAIDGYEAYWDAFDDIFDPSGGGPTLVDETTASPYREFVLELIDDLAANGQLIRGRPETFPEFYEISSTSDLVIIDCQTTNPNLGVYAETGSERTSLIPPINDGQTDVSEATMKLEGGVWKVSDLQAVVAQECVVPQDLGTLQVAGG